jgi:hypothetical protein
MPRSTTHHETPSAADRAAMHERYRSGGEARRKAPHVVYADAACPHLGCDHPMRAIDFRLEDHGKDVHDSLVTAWWKDLGFAGRCPQCGGWIHFTILGKRAISADEARRLPNLPDDWHEDATIL